MGWADLHLKAFHASSSPRSIFDVQYYDGGSRSHYMRLDVELSSGACFVSSSSSQGVSKAEGGPDASGSSRDSQLRGAHSPRGSTRGSATRMLRRTCEFPTLNPAINGRPHRYAWVLADMADDDVHWGPPQAVVKLTLPVAGTRGPNHQDSVPSSGGGGRASQPENIIAGTSSRTMTGRRSASRTSSGSSTSSTSSGSSHSGSVSGTSRRQTPYPAMEDVWYVGDKRFPPGEPCFIPRPGAVQEDDGWLLVVLHNAASGHAELAILDAAAPSKGPMALIQLPHRLPMGLHGCWSSTFFGPAAGSEDQGLTAPAAAAAAAAGSANGVSEGDSVQLCEKGTAGGAAGGALHTQQKALPAGVRVTGRVRPLA